MRFYDLLQITNVTPPALPTGMPSGGGLVITGSDAGGVHLKSASNAANGINLGLASIGPLTIKYTVKIANTGNPSASFFYPSFHSGGYPQLVMSRGSSEARGALWFQNGSGLLSGTAVGTSGTTFTQNQTYNFIVNCLGDSTGSGETHTVAVQRQSDGLWLTAAGAWQATFTNAISFVYTPTADNMHACSINWANATGDILLYSMQWSSPPMMRVGQSPVIAKGATYDGWVADALAAPAACWDGTRFVMNVSFWNIANSKWAGGFFTSSDLKNWTYVTGSLMTPSTGNYIKANSGLCYFAGKYYLVYGEYPSGTPAINFMATSTDLLTWTSVTLPAPATNAQGWSDASLNLNPTNGKMELWMAHSNGMYLWDTPDGTTWTSQGAMMANSSGYSLWGEPAVFYIGTTRYLTHDLVFTSKGVGRGTMLWASPNQDTNWIRQATMHDCTTSNAWEAGQVFDASPIVFDMGDGRGPLIWYLYAGGSNTSNTDNTASGIGLATYMIVPPPPPMGMWNGRAGGRRGQF